MAIDFSSIRAAVLDMDGVIWRGSQTLPGAPEFFTFLGQHQIPFALATNNSTKTVDTYVEHLTTIGILAKSENIITSAVAAAEYIKSHYPTDTPVYIIGGDGIRRNLASLGYQEDPERAKLVVVGLDFAVTYDKLKTATLLINAGADFIGTNGDRTFPLPEGLVPGNGSILAAIEAATDKKPLVIGKPEAAMFEVALRRLGTTPEQTVMIGDRLETDIFMGQQAGMVTAVTLTGVSRREDVARMSSPPDFIIENIAELPGILTQLVP
jgi:4-nitrophenyl phosphatase